MKIGYKVVNDGQTKGIIITADTLLDLKGWLNTVDGNADNKAGAKAVIEFLEDCYRKVR